MLLDGTLVCACLVLAAQADGHEVTTVEGLADGDSLHAVQQAFVDAGAVQCGFCTPGLVVATVDLLRRNASPSDDEIREALSGNLCRCTGYAKIFDAVRMAVGDMTQTVRTLQVGKIGELVPRLDAPPKVKGEFVYASDLIVPGMLWGHTLRSPHAHARIVELDISAAVSMPGVHAVLTHADVPGTKFYGLEFQDQPVLAIDRVLYYGEPVALVAAEHPEQARRAAERIRVEYELLEPVADMERATELADLHPDQPTRGPRLLRRSSPECRASHPNPARRPRSRRATCR